MENKLKTCLLYILMCLLFVQCKNKNKKNNNNNLSEFDKNHIVKKWIDSNSILYEEQFLINGNDSINDGFFKLYYKNGKMLASGFYKNNKQDSMFYTFYENGKPFQKEHFSAGHNFGSQYQYYENGNIKSYTLISTHFFRNNGYQFRIDYDSMQRIKKTTGELIYLQIDNKKDLYLPSDSILLNFIIAKPENYKTVFTVKLDNKLNNHPEELTSAKLDYMLWADLYFCQIPVECHNADMPITYIGILKLYDSLTNKLIIGDSVSYEVKVKK